MADVIDMANDQADYLLQVALGRRQQVAASAVSALDCVGCGGPIPEPRRLAVVGCETCIDCQTLRERSK